MAGRHEWVDSGRALRRHPTGEQCHARKQHDDCDKDSWVVRPHAAKHSREAAHKRPAKQGAEYRVYRGTCDLSRIRTVLSKTQRKGLESQPPPPSPRSWLGEATDIGLSVLAYRSLVSSGHEQSHRAVSGPDRCSASEARSLQHRTRGGGPVAT